MRSFSFQVIKPIFLLLSYLPFQSFSIQIDPCKKNFTGSLREAQALANIKAADWIFYPQFKNIQTETELAKHWSSEKIIGLQSLRALIPENVSFVNHRLRESRGPSFVKFPPDGASLILRVKYTSQGKNLETNMTLSKLSLIDNLETSKKWLIGPSVKAGILFLHGGGTKSTGGHVAETLINHLYKHKIAVISPDLPWHGEGPRTFMGTLDQEIQALSDLTKKYVHPQVPLFIWGHSWGGSLAHRVMQMSDKGTMEEVFHKNLKGLIITSPAVDSAPGQSLHTKKKAYQDRRNQSMKMTTQIAPAEKDLFIQMVADGKTNPMGGFFSSLTIAQLDDIISSHGGKNYIPALMIVGKGDQLVYLGFEDLFKAYYDQLSNVKTHYLNKLPYMFSRDKTKNEIVGHLLGDYMLPGASAPVHFDLGLGFISKILGSSGKLSNPQESSTIARYLVDFLQLWANDLSFREWAEHAKIVKIFKRRSFSKLEIQRTKKEKELINILENFSPRVSFTTLLQNFISQTDKIDLEKVLSKARRYHSFFGNNPEFRIFLSNFAQAETVKKAKILAIKMLQIPLFLQPSKKEVIRLSQEVLSLNDHGGVKRIWKKYNYISKEEIKTLIPLIQEVIKLKQRIKEIYIPTVEDYKTVKFLNLEEQEIIYRIEWIKGNIEDRKKLEEEIKAVNSAIGKLKTKINKNLDLISQYSRQIRMAFDEATINPPDPLREEYKKSEEELIHLYELSEQMNDQLDKVAFESLEKNKFNLDYFQESLSAHKTIVEEFGEKYDMYMCNRNKLCVKLIKAIQNGALSNQLEKIANDLYGPIGLYAKTEVLSIELAEKETEKLRLSKKQAHLLEEYNKWIPFESLSRVEHIPVKDVLNLQIQDTVSLKKYKQYFHEVDKAWKALNSQILPLLPEQESNY